MLENVVDRLVDQLVGWRVGAPAAAHASDPAAADAFKAPDSGARLHGGSTTSVGTFGALFKTKSKA